jgi:hypothetical protein
MLKLAAQLWIPPLALVRVGPTKETTIEKQRKRRNFFSLRCGMFCILRFGGKVIRSKKYWTGRSPFLLYC